MPDLDELFNSASLVGGSEYTPDYLVINNDFRTITIPSSKKLLGVTSDDSVNILNFRCPRYYGTVDLSPLTFRINYMNAMGEGDIYAVQDKTVDDSEITFSWTVGRHACRYSGSVRFIVCAYLSSNGTITQEYNTAVHTLPVVQGLETSEAVVEAECDLIAEFLENINSAATYTSRAETAATSAEASKTAAANSATSASTSAASASASATSAGNSATSASNSWSLVQQSAQIVESCVTATESANNAAETARESSSIALAGYLTSKAYGKEVIIENAADNVPVKDLKIKMEPHQDLHGYDHPWPGGAGKNLLKIPVRSATQSGVTFTVNNDGSVTVKGTTTNTSCSFNLNYVNSTTLSEPIGTFKYGCNATSSSIGLQINVDGGGLASANGDEFKSITIPSDATCAWARIRVWGEGTTVDETVYPMRCLDTETDSSWEPYSNICPIEGYDEVTVRRHGKNLLNIIVKTETTKAGITFTPNLDSTGNVISITVKGTTTDNNTFFNLNYQPGICNIPKGSNFIVTGGKDGVIVQACTPTARDKDRSMNGNPSPSFFVPSDTVTSWVRLSISGTGTTVDTIIYPMLCLDTETDLSYELYQDNTYDVTFPSATTGTVYSGTLDVTTGILTVEWISVTYDGSSDEAWDFAGETAPYYLWVIKNDSIRTSSAPYCNILIGVTGTNKPSSGYISVVGSSSYNVRANFGVAFNNLSELQAWLAEKNLQIVAKLTNPITYQLTATDVTTILGKNWIETNADDMDLEYRLAPAYISKKIDDCLAGYATETVSGPIVSFDDGADDVPVKDLKVQITPKQDHHGYDYPWPAGGGKNLCPIILKEEAVRYGYVATPQSDGSIIVTGTWAGSANNVITQNGGGVDVQTNFSLPVGNYILTGCGENYNALYGISLQVTYSGVSYRDNGNGVNFTISESTDVLVRVYVQNSYAGTIPSEGIVLHPMIRLASETDATFEPYSNICPIEGWNTVNIYRFSKNLLKNKSNDVEIKDGITYTKNSDGSITANGTVSKTNSQYYIPIDTSIIYGKFKFSAFINSAGNGIDAYMWDGTLSQRCKKWNGSDGSESSTDSALKEVIIEKDHETNLILRITGVGSIINNVIFNPMLVSSDVTDASYEPPCKDNTYNITLPSSAGTVYGGTLDVTMGELVVNTVKLSFDGTEIWSRVGSNPYYMYRYTYNGKRLSANIETVQRGCTHFRNAYVITDSSDSGYAAYTSSSTTTDSAFIQFRPSLNNNIILLEDWIAWLKEQKANGTPLSCWFEILEPFVYQCTPQEIESLLGTNNIGSDAGDVTIEYRADTKKYIAKQIAAAIAELN